MGKSLYHNRLTDVIKFHNVRIIMPAKVVFRNGRIYVQSPRIGN